MIPLKDLITTVTVDAFEAKALVIAKALGLPTASWHLGSMIRTIVRIFCELLSPLVDLQVDIVRGGFLDLAEGIWLDALSQEVYNVTREPATFAAGQLTLNNSAGGSHTFAARQFRVYNPATKKVYTNVSAFTLAPLQLGLVIDIEAVEIGSASSSGIGTITALETTLIGVTVSNAAAVIGLDPEIDSSVRLRCRLKLGSLSPNGPADAYRYVALSKDLNGGVDCNRAKAMPPNSTGSFILYVAGPNGALTGPQVTLIQNAVNKLCKPTGFDCIVTSAANRVLGVTAVAYVYARVGVVAADLQAAALLQLANYIPTLDIGGDYTTPGAGRVFVNTIESEIRRARTSGGDPLVPQIHKVEVSLPASDLVVAANEVVTSGVTSITVTVVP